MRYPGFVGPTGELATVNIDAERTINFYPERVDAGTPKSRFWLRPTPGLKSFASCPGNGPVTQLFHQDGRAFAVSGDRFCEIGSDGTVTQRGLVTSDSGRATIVSNGAIGGQLFIVAGLSGYVFTLSSNAFAQITSAGFPAACLSGAFADSYGLALYNGTPKFGFSSLADFSTWDALDVAQKSQTSDNLKAMVYDGNDLWLKGSKTTEIWSNTGDASNPWAPQPVHLSGGIDAPDSAALGDGGIFWVQATENGAKNVVRSRGYSIEVIGSQAVHTAIAGYATTDDAIGWYQEIEGHGFYWLTYPTEDATWVYDVQTRLWHERLYWDSTDGAYEAHLARCHTYAFGKHLVGSRVDGTIYELADSAMDDDGDTIRRLRRAPHVASENRTIYHSRFELDMKTGVGKSSGQGSDPLIVLRVSDDGGNTWSSEMQAGLGGLQQYKRTVYWQRLGRSRNRVYEVVVTDPVFAGILDAYLTLGGRQ